MQKFPVILSLAIVFSLFTMVGTAEAVVEAKGNPDMIEQRQELREDAQDLREVKGELLEKREEVRDDLQEVREERQELLSGASQSARANMAKVSNQVKTLLEMKEDVKGIGQKVKVVAQEQIRSQERISEKLAKMEEKKIWLKKMFGYDKEAVQGVQEEIISNETRIAELEQLKSETTDKTEIASLDEAVASLIDQNTSLQDTVQEEMQNQGVWGWFRGFFKRN